MDIRDFNKIFEINMYGIQLYEFLWRVFIACIIGGLFGLERKNKGKPAGIKTNMLACSGAALVALIQMMIYNKYSLGLEGGISGDPTRLTAQVISGLGFLGAGVIMTGGDKVVGLTTAATLWLVAILGIGIGYGFEVYIILSAIMILTLSYLIKKFEVSYIDKRKLRKVILECVQNAEIEEIIEELILEKDIKVILDRTVSQTGEGENIVIKRIMHFSMPKYVRSSYFFGILKKYEDVKSITYIK